MQNIIYIIYIIYDTRGNISNIYDVLDLSYRLCFFCFLYILCLNQGIRNAPWNASGYPLTALWLPSPHTTAPLQSFPTRPNSGLLILRCTCLPHIIFLLSLSPILTWFCRFRNGTVRNVAFFPGKSFIICRHKCDYFVLIHCTSCIGISPLLFLQLQV